MDINSLIEEVPGLPQLTPIKKQAVENKDSKLTPKMEAQTGSQDQNSANKVRFNDPRASSPVIPEFTSFPSQLTTFQMQAKKNHPNQSKLFKAQIFQSNQPTMIITPNKMELDSVKQKKKKINSGLISKSQAFLNQVERSGKKHQVPTIAERLGQPMVMIRRLQPLSKKYSVESVSKASSLAKVIPERKDKRKSLKRSWDNPYLASIRPTKTKPPALAENGQHRRVKSGTHTPLFQQIDML